MPDIVTIRFRVAHPIPEDDWTKQAAFMLNVYDDVELLDVRVEDQIDAFGRDNG